MINDADIDLTEHRDFGDRIGSPNFIRLNGQVFSDIGTYINRTFKRQVFGDIPWNVTPIGEKAYKFDGLVALGNKEQRAYAINSAYWGTTENKTCDCCGRKYIKIPWKKDWGLCKECDEDMRSDFIIPWRTLFI